MQSLKQQGVNRESLFIQTKFTPPSGQDPFNIPYNPSSPIAGQVQQSVQASLRNLNTEYLNALLLHSPLPTHAQTMEAWQVLEELNQQGLVHKLGISNCYELDDFEKIYHDATVKPSILQNRFYAETDYDKEMRHWCSEKNIIYQSFWTLTANPHILSHPNAATFSCNSPCHRRAVIFPLSYVSADHPLIGTCSEKHMQEDLAIFDFALTDNEISRIIGLLYALKKSWQRT